MLVLVPFKRPTGLRRRDAWIVGTVLETQTSALVQVPPKGTMIGGDVAAEERGEIIVLSHMRGHAIRPRQSLETVINRFCKNRSGIVTRFIF